MARVRSEAAISKAAKSYKHLESESPNAKELGTLGL